MIMVVVINYGDLAHANGGCDGDGGDGDNDNGVAMMVVVSLLLMVNDGGLSRAGVGYTRRRS